MNWKGYARKWSWQNLKYFYVWTEKHEKAVSIAGVPAENRTGPLSNTSQNRYLVSRLARYIVKNAPSRIDDTHFFTVEIRACEIKLK
jgi:hypothetical protein